MAWKKAIWSLRLRLHSGLRQRGRAFGPGLYLGLRPRLVYVGPLALFLDEFGIFGGFGDRWLAN